MIKTGLVSVSFRQLSADEIIKACVENGLGAIEWGGDVHVPAGDVKTAREVAEKTKKAGLECAAYGSYYKIACRETDYPSPDFGAVLASAEALGAKTIRIWGGWRPACEYSEDELEKAVSECRKICAAAKEKGITLSFECHGGTITDDYHCALSFLKRVNSDNLKMYFQPNQAKSEEYNVEAARALSPYVTNVHVFNWDSENKRYPLANGLSAWKKYYGELKSGDRAFMLEFMPDNDISSLPAEASALKAILGKDL